MNTESDIKTNRLTWLDTLKGLLILLVIWGHSTGSHGTHNYLGSFYMPAFFMASGYTMNKNLKLSMRKYLANRAIAIIGPYLLFSVLWIGYSCLKQLIAPSGFSVVSAVTSIFLPYSGRPNGSVYIFWFLPCIFLAQTIFSLVLYNTGVKKLIGAVSLLVCLICGIILENGSFLICTVMAIVFLGIGYMARIFRGGVQQILINNTKYAYAWNMCNFKQ